MIIDSYPYYMVTLNEDKKWYWIYYDKHGVDIAHSTESFSNQDDCIKTISAIQRSKESMIYYSE